MALDVPTLFAVSTFVPALLGLFLLIAWIDDRSIRALAWWGAAYLIGGSSVALWNQAIESTSILPDSAPNAMLFIACGMIWNGARLFYNREILPVALIAGATAWLLACQFPGFAAWGPHRIILSSIIISIYAFLTAIELWRERRKATAARLFTICVPALHAIVFLLPIPLTMLLPEDVGTSVYSNNWFPLFALETLIYAVGTAFLLLFIAKDRTALILKTAAVTDALTGLFNRRGFTDTAQRLLNRQAAAGEGVTVLMFDLDHFKSINDRFGHFLGDEVLRHFAMTVSSNMRSTDIVGRLGGEEFAAVLPGSLAIVLPVAERVRAAFEMQGREVSGRLINATVSIGAASTTGLGKDIQMLLGEADAALYCAKARGRNRVEAALESSQKVPVPAALPEPARPDRPLVPALNAS
jgi:diguanylate cyclase (GGDEF)-like protein